MVKWISLLSFFWGATALAELTFEESRKAATTIGKWLSKSSAHFDYLPASPIAPKRAGETFFVRGSKAPLQTASDYGLSMAEVPIDNDVSRAYQLMGFAPNEIARTIYLDRVHLGWGLGNLTDFTLSYFHSTDGMRGWGAGLKRVFSSDGRYYFSYRLQYGRSQLDNYFENISINQDVIASYYLRLIDLYAGIRHSYGKISFESSRQELKLPTAEFFGTVSELELFYGITIATTLNTRITLQSNQVGGAFSWAAKFSLHFDSLLPTMTRWFGDPRALKQ